MSREQLAKDNGMTIEFVNWFFDNKKEGCGNAWFMMMAAMWEGWIGREAKCAELAAENAVMLETIEAVRSVADNSSGIAGWHLNGDIATWEEILPEINDIETPATDAFLAEVRAQGLNAFIQHHSAELDAHIKNGGKQFDEKPVRIRGIIVSARLFREQIRKGVQS